MNRSCIWCKHFELDLGDGYEGCAGRMECGAEVFDWVDTYDLPSGTSAAEFLRQHDDCPKFEEDGK